MDKSRELEIWDQCLDGDLSGNDLHDFLIDKCGGENKSYENIMELMGFDSNETLTPPEENLIATLISEEQAVETETLIEGFNIIAEVGRGGMGVILKAYDRDMHRTVAVKVLREKHRHNPYVIRRFSLEPRIAGHVSHTGIPPVYSHGLTDDGRPYFAMKLIEGQTLSEIMKAECCEDGSRLIQIFRSVCATMAYTHECGIVNLDIKSQNVMVGKFGEVQVTDWGISQRFKGIINMMGLVSPLDSDTEDEQIVGTVGIMPPEQLSGNVELLKSPTCDVYSLGVLLGQIITCDRRATDASLRDSLLSDCKASKLLVDAVAKCISREQKDRYSDASELLEVIDEYLETQRARRKEVEVKLAAASKVRGNMTIALAVVCSALIVLAWALVGISNATRSLRLANRGLSEANANKVRANNRLRHSLHTTHAMLAADSLEKIFMPRRAILSLIAPVKKNSLAKKLLTAKLNRGVIAYSDEDTVLPEAEYVEEGDLLCLVSESVDGKSFVCSRSGKSAGIQVDRDDCLIDLDCMEEVEPMGRVTSVFYDGIHAICGTEDGTVAVYQSDESGLSLKKVVRSDMSPILSISASGETVTCRSEKRVTTASLVGDTFEEVISQAKGSHATSVNGKHTVVNAGRNWTKMYDNVSKSKVWEIKGTPKSKWCVSDRGNLVVCVTPTKVKAIRDGVVVMEAGVSENHGTTYPLIDKTETHFYTASWISRKQYEILRWSIETGEIESRTSIRGKPIFTAAEDGIVITASGSSLFAVDTIASGFRLLTKLGSRVSSGSRSPSGFVLSEESGLVSLWARTEEGEYVKSQSFDTGIQDITCVAMSFIGESCLVISETQGTWMYNISGGERIIFIDESITRASFAQGDSAIYTQDSSSSNNTGIKRWTTE